MSSANVIRDGFPGGNRRSYIATETFTSRFYSYTTSTVDGITSGTFTQVTNNDALCPKGRILRENGRKLFPGANPNVPQYMVGVYDAKTFLNGFIDPNTHVFSSFNTDKSYYVANDIDRDLPNGTGGEDLGDPVYTRGNVETISGDILANPNGGDNIIALRNDISGSIAQFYFDGDENPYVEVRTGGVNPGDNVSYGYMEVDPTTANMTLYAPTEARINLSLGIAEGADGSVLISATGDEAKIELDISGATQVSAYASNGSIFNTGLLHPYNACGQVTLGTTGGAGASTATVTIDNSIPLNSDALVFLSHVTVTNAGGGGDFNGFLRYNFPSGQTLRINSTGQNDTSTVNYLIVSKSASTP